MIDAGLYNSAEKIFSTYAQRFVYGAYPADIHFTLCCE
jgi:hypothetical protein